jgi:hypothetical protein
MGGVEKTTVYLSSSQKAALARAAEAQGRTAAQLIRAGVEAVTRHRTAEASPALVAEGEGLAQRSISAGRPRWISRDAFVRLVVPRQADAGLRGELHDLAPGTTDDEELR